jgi:hypothetical protein
MSIAIVAINRCDEQYDADCEQQSVQSVAKVVRLIQREADIEDYVRGKEHSGSV